MHPFAPPEDPYNPLATDTFSQEQVQAEARAAELQRQRRGIEAQILSTPAGREWAWQFLQECHVFETHISMTGAREHGFWEGRREVGLSLMRRLAATSPDNFARLLAENYV